MRGGGVRGSAGRSLSLCGGHRPGRLVRRCEASHGRRADRRRGMATGRTLAEGWQGLRPAPGGGGRVAARMGADAAGPAGTGRHERSPDRVSCPMPPSCDRAARLRHGPAGCHGSVRPAAGGAWAGAAGREGDRFAGCQLSRRRPALQPSGGTLARRSGLRARSAGLRGWGCRKKVPGGWAREADAVLGPRTPISTSGPVAEPCRVRRRLASLGQGHHGGWLELGRAPGLGLGGRHVADRLEKAVAVPMDPSRGWRTRGPPASATGHAAGSPRP